MGVCSKQLATCDSNSWKENLFGNSCEIVLQLASTSIRIYDSIHYPDLEIRLKLSFHFLSVPHRFSVKLTCLTSLSFHLTFGYSHSDFWNFRSKTIIFNWIHQWCAFLRNQLVPLALCQKPRSSKRSWTSFRVLQFTWPPPAWLGWAQLMMIPLQLCRSKLLRYVRSKTCGTCSATSMDMTQSHRWPKSCSSLKSACKHLFCDNSRTAGFPSKHPALKPPWRSICT